MSIAQALVKLFIPHDEPDPNDTKAIQSHKKAMAIWRHWIGWSQLLLWGFFWWAIGMGSALGIDALGMGFARAETVSRIEVQLLSQSILETRIRQCNASSAEGRRYFLTLLQEKLKQYHDLTGQDYPLPSCADLEGIK